VVYVFIAIIIGLLRVRRVNRDSAPPLISESVQFEPRPSKFPLEGSVPTPCENAKKSRHGQLSFSIHIAINNKFIQDNYLCCDITCLLTGNLQADVYVQGPVSAQDRKLNV